MTEEVADLLPGRAQTSNLVVSGFLTLVCAGEHVGKQLQRDRQEKLSEWNKNKNRKGDEAAKVLDSATELRQS